MASSYVSVVSGTVVLMANNVETRLAMTMSALASYLRANNLTQLLEDVEGVEEHFLDGGEFLLEHNATNVVTKVTRVLHEPTRALGNEEACQYEVVKEMGHEDRAGWLEESGPSGSLEEGDGQREDMELAEAMQKMEEGNSKCKPQRKGKGDLKRSLKIFLL